VTQERPPPFAAPRLTLVVAVADNGVIGRNQTLPWRLPDDLKRFKGLTLGKPVLMGRRTWSSLGRPLPGRDNLVLTRDREFSRLPAAHGALVVHTLAEALARCPGFPEIAVIGGAEVYREALPFAERIEITRVHAEVAGDTWFPALAPEEWQSVRCEAHAADAQHAFAMTFETLVRVSPRARVPA
jgi:dihydrofolate reductase